MDRARIKEYIDLMAACGVSELEIRSGDEAIRIVRPLSAPAGIAARPADAAVDAGGQDGARASAGMPVRAPMAGTFFLAPEPGAEPFIRVGQTVAPGDVVCILESMKMMNEIVADRGGVCVAIEVANGVAVSAGDTLMRIA
jgi:acetyl-CoA carboxylase biotin carboxyl carrier protein